MNFEEKFDQALKQLPDYSILTLYIDPNQYFPALSKIMSNLVDERGMAGIYITTTRPAKAIQNRLALKNIDMGKVYFVDCISYSVGANVKVGDEVQYVESPTQLESVMLKTYWLLKKIESEHKFVFLDSLNTLGIYNDEKMLSEFLHLFINKLRTKEIFGVILSVGEDPPKDTVKMLELVCDESLEMRQKHTKEG